MNSENQWYFVADDEEGRHKEGPVSGEELEAMLSAGRIFPVTPVWREGMADWAQIGTVPEFSKRTQEGSSPSQPDSESTGPCNSDSSEDEAKANRPSDLVTIKEFDNHTVQFSKSRNVLLIATNDNHVGPLALTKLDLLAFLTAMESTNHNG